MLLEDSSMAWVIGEVEEGIPYYTNSLSSEPVLIEELSVSTFGDIPRRLSCRVSIIVVKPSNGIKNVNRICNRSADWPAFTTELRFYS